MRRSLASTLAIACLATTTLVLGQGRKTIKPRPKPRPPAAITNEPRATPQDDKPKNDDEPAAPSDSPGASANGGEIGSEGPSSPASKTFGDAGVRSSPLNPRPEEFPDSGAVSTPADLDKILGDIATLRARVASIGDTLFKSRIVLRLETSGDHAKIGRLSLSLDEGVVYTAPAGFIADDETTVYEHAVAPGRHVLGVDIDRRDDRGESFRTGQHARVTLEVPENQRLETTIRIDDDSDMGSHFPSSQKGSYDLRVRVLAKARK